MTRTRICLIIPPSVFLNDEKVFPNLGILCCAAVLEQAGHEVSVVDLNGVANYLECLEQALKGLRFSFIGITCTSPQMVACKQIVERLREIAPNCPLVLGGPHVTGVISSERLDRSGKGSGRGIKQRRELEELVDILVAGDGELAVFKIVEAVEQGAIWPLLIDADDPSSDLFLSEEALLTMPFPARHLIALDSYHYEIEGRPSTNLISELGCPYACTFCGMRNSPSFRRVRARTPESVRQELVHLNQQYNLSGFMFSDDELNIPSSFAALMREIVRAQEIAKCDFRLRGFIKSNLLTEDQARSLHDAGFRNLLVGFESGSDEVLLNINKKATRDQNTRCMEIASRHGLHVKALISLGHPAESEETIEQTRDWLLEVQPQDFDATIITVYPSTPYADFSRPHASIPGAWTFTAPKTGDRLHFFDVDFLTQDSYYKGIPGSYKSYVFSDFLSCERLVELRDGLEREVRHKLGIPFYPVNPGARFESSMGMTPTHILRSSTLPKLSIIP